MFPSENCYSKSPLICPDISVMLKFFILGGKRRLRYHSYACGKKFEHASISNQIPSFRMETS